MLGYIFVFSLFAYICWTAFYRPWVGVCGFLGFVLLSPQWNWRWSLPPGFEFQKYMFVCLLIGFLVSGCRGNPFRGIVGISAISFLGFLGIAFISSTQSISPRYTDFFMDVIWKIVVVALLAIRLLDKPDRIWVMLWVVVLANGYNCYRINDDYLSLGYCSYVRSKWAGYGSNQLSNLIVCCSACSLGLLVFCEKEWQRMIALLVLLMQAHCIMLLESRGCMLGMGVLVFAAMIFMPKTQRNLRGAAIVFVATLVLAGPPVVREFSSIFASEGEIDTSASSRFLLWKAGAAIVRDYPILGVGPYAGQAMVPRYYEGGMNVSAKGLHNLFFEIATGCGLPASMLYFSFLLLPSLECSRRLWKYRKSRIDPRLHAGMFAAACGIPGFMVANMFSAGALIEGSYVLSIIGGASVLVHRATLAETARSTVAVSESVEKSSPARSVSNGAVAGTS